MKLLGSVLLIIGTSFLLLGCGNTTNSKHQVVGSTNNWGDPYISMAQANRVHKGESSAAVFSKLGGKAYSGKGPPAASAPAVIHREYAQYPVNCYDYPVVNTSHGWAFCFEYGKLISKRFEQSFGD